MRSCWTKKEENLLLLHYSDKGAIGCRYLLSRTQKAICKKARKLGLSTKTTLGGVPSKKLIVEQINKIRGIVRCDRHGYTTHYLSLSRSPVCLICRRGWDKKRSQKPSRKLRVNKLQRKKYRILIHNYADRLRRTLRFYSHGEISFSKHLPYFAQQLCDYLENIKKQQHNHCPMCQQSYDCVKLSIDHIIPLITARTKKDILRLFDLSNLSLLCQPCNSSKGGKLCL